MSCNKKWLFLGLGGFILVALIVGAGCWLWPMEKDEVPKKDFPISGIVRKKTGKSELFEKYYTRAEKIMSDMTLEEKITQMFLVRMPEYGIEEEIVAYQPGGYIMFGVDFDGETPDTIRQKLAKYQELSKFGLLFGVDEEGGTVVRVSLYPIFRTTKFLSPQELLAQGGLGLILQDVNEKSQLLKDLGINMNLAPVADVPTSPEVFIYKRSYGQDAVATAEYVASVIERMNQDNIISVMKHFPGYGDNVDTHTGVAVDSRSLESLREADFLPFVAGINVGGPAILVSHNIVTDVDSELPASLSGKMIAILRDELDFSGIIMTDDLAMGAVSTYDAEGRIATQAVLAGNDLLITSRLSEHFQQVVEAVECGEVSEEIIDTAVRRLLAMKLQYGILK